ncbi:hypothetical protein ACEPAG_1634 [Sanghuangporus baumii]
MEIQTLVLLPEYHFARVFEKTPSFKDFTSATDTSHTNEPDRACHNLPHPLQGVTDDHPLLFRTRSRAAGGVSALSIASSTFGSRTLSHERAPEPKKSHSKHTGHKESSEKAARGFSSSSAIFITSGP